jgi:predicted Zn finger-like uncharacterized protein
MPIAISCPHCAAGYNLPDTQRGKTVRCKKCQNTFSVEMKEDQVQARFEFKRPAALEKLLKDDILPANASAPKKSSALPVVLTVIAAVCLLGLVAVVGAGIWGLRYLTAKRDALFAENQNKAEAMFQEVQAKLDEAAKQTEDGERPFVKPIDEKRAKADKARKAISWVVKPDPLGEKMQGPFATSASITVPFQTHALFPSTPSPFVAVNVRGKNVPAQFKVYDLRTMKMVGTPIDRNFLKGAALSPDGKWIAAPAEGTAKPSIEVFSVAEGKSARVIEVGEPGTKIGLVDFAVNDRLITEKLETNSTIHVWDIKTGNETVHFHIGQRYNGRWTILSPGRKYLAQEDTEEAYHIFLWDLETGKVAGVFPIQGPEDGWGIGAGMAFSPDGGELAMVWTQPRKDFFGRLLVWDLNTRKKLHDHKIQGSELNQFGSLTSAGGIKTLQYWPEHNGWLLFGHLLMDSESGAFVARLGPEPKFTGNIMDRRFLDRDYITTTGGKFDKQITLEALPRGQIDEAIKKARSQAKGSAE